MSKEFDEYGEATTAGALNWKERELSDEYVSEREKRGTFDIPFFILTVVILAIGVVMVLSASFAREYYSSGNPLKIFSRQAIFAVSGIALMIFTSRFKVATMQRWSMLLLVVSIGLLAAVLVIGSRANGAKRWINLGFTTLQPSEITKVAVVMAFASMICTFKKRMETFKYGVLPFGIIVAIIVALLLCEPHLSASVIIIAVAAIMMFTGGTRLRWFAMAGIIVALVAFVVVTQFDYAGGRIGAWRDPELDPQGAGYQIRQSLLAVGSGGVLGQGLGQSRQKYLYLPEEHNDYIFAIVCEELGFVGAMLILMLFSLLIIRGFWLALHAKDRYGSLIVTGITSLLAIQVFLNVAVVTNLLPSTGISLPFFSYGGTALWIQLVEMGIILAVSREIPLAKAG